MASEVFFNRVPYTQRRLAPSLQTHDLFASNHASSSSSSSSTSHLQTSVGTTRSGGALTFPPLYLDPVDSHNVHDPSSNQHANNPAAQQPGSFVLGSTFYHHPELNALVSNHLIDASANAPDGASGTRHAFLNSIFANRDAAHDDDSDTDEAGANGADAALAVPRPKITSEFVSLNEDLVPASLDMHGDMLPADQHPSYPFGNLFGPLGGVIAADSAIVGGTAAASASGSLGSGLGDAAATLGLDFGGGLDGFVNLGQSSHGRRSAVSHGWNNFINKASRSKLVGSAGAHADWDLEAQQKSSASTSTAASSSSSLPREDNELPSRAEIARSAKKLDLSPSLLFRTNTSTVLAPPTWPFRRHGPGCTSYAALLRPSSNIYGTSPASQAVAATLGGLPASSKIIKEVWSDLALEELVPLRVGETSATRHLRSHNEQEEMDADAGASGAEKRSKKRSRSDPESDSVFSKRIANMEADPLDLLGPISREIRGQASRPWGTAISGPQRRSRRRRSGDQSSAYSNQSEDEEAEAEHDDPEQGFTQRDRLRYSFALPPATFSWTESPEHDDPDERNPQEPHAAGTVHVEPDGIGWSTAKRIFINEERDRLLPEVASRATGASGEIEPYQVTGLRANQGILPRPTWSWTDGPVEDTDLGNTSFVTEMSASTSHQTDLHAQSVADSEQAQYATEDGQMYQQNWQQIDADEPEDDDQDEVDDAELQRALLMHYQTHADGEADHHQSDDQHNRYDDDDDDDDDVQDEDEEEVAEALGYEDDDEEAALEQDEELEGQDDQEEDVDSFDEAEGAV